jgi:hypothetical protein
MILYCVVAFQQHLYANRFDQMRNPINQDNRMNTNSTLLLLANRGKYHTENDLLTIELIKYDTSLASRNDINVNVI